MANKINLHEIKIHLTVEFNVHETFYFPLLKREKKVKAIFQGKQEENGNDIHSLISQETFAFYAMTKCFRF